MNARWIWYHDQYSLIYHLRSANLKAPFHLIMFSSFFLYISLISYIFATPFYVQKKKSSYILVVFLSLFLFFAEIFIKNSKISLLYLFPTFLFLNNRMKHFNWLLLCGFQLMALGILFQAGKVFYEILSLPEIPLQAKEFNITFHNVC